MFIAKQGNLIVQVANSIEELEQKTAFMSDVNIEEVDTDYTLINGKFLTKEEVDIENSKKIAMLKMTPLDFIKALEEVGVSYSQIKELCNTNEEVEKQLRFCNHVYRGNPLLDKLCGQFNITKEQLDELFKKYGI